MSSKCHEPRNLLSSLILEPPWLMLFLFERLGNGDNKAFGKLPKLTVRNSKDLPALLLHNRSLHVIRKKPEKDETFKTTDPACAVPGWNQSHVELSSTWNSGAGAPARASHQMITGRMEWGPGLSSLIPSTLSASCPPWDEEPPLFRSPQTVMVYPSTEDQADMAESLETVSKWTFLPLACYGWNFGHSCKCVQC